MPPVPEPADLAPGIRYATSADGTKIAYAGRGSSEVPLVGVYAWFSSGVEWFSAAEPTNLGFGGIMARRGAYLLYARRGTEASQRDVSDVSFDAQVADLEAVVSDAGLTKIDLIGFSDGAAICLAYAALHPDQVRKVVLWGGFARGSEFIASEGAQRIVAQIRNDWALARQSMAMSTLSSRTISGTDLRAGIAAIAEYTSQEIAARYIEAISAMDVSHHLASVRAPVLVLHRKGDTFDPFEAGKAVALALPNAHLIPLEGDNPYLHPDEDFIAGLVTEFLDGVKPPPPAVQPPPTIDTTPGIRYATSADGTKIAYAVHGRGIGVPLVLISAWWAAATPVEAGDFHVIRELKKERPVILYPRRGIGPSQRDVTDVSLDAQVADLDAIVQALGATEVDLFCVSDGAMAGITYAARNPSRVRKLTFWGGFTRGTDLFRSDGARRLTALVRSDWELARTNLVTALISSRTQPMMLRQAAAGLREVMSQEVAALYIEAIAATDATPDAARVAAPALVLHRRDDTFDPFKAGQTLASALPNARFLAVDGDDPQWADADDEVIAGPMIEFLDGAKPAAALPPAPESRRAIDTTPGIRYATSADGTKIAYEVYGGGPSLPLVFVSAWWAVTAMGPFRQPIPVVEALYEGRPVVLYARRGIGASQRDVADVSFEAQVADLRAIVEHLGAEQVDLLGVSDGAAVALAVAARATRHIRNIALWGAFGRGPDFVKPEAANRLATLIRTDWSLARRTMTMSVGSSVPTTGNTLRRNAGFMGENMSQEIAAGYIEAVAALDVSSELKGVGLPVLALHRLNDTYAPFLAGQSVAAALPNCRFLAVEGDDPMWSAGDVELVAEPIIEFLDGAKPEVAPRTTAVSTAGTRYVNSADGTRIAYMTMGSGRPLVFALPNPTSIELDWELPDVRAFFEGLLPGRMLVRFDMRGTASSQRDVTDMSAEAMANDLLAVANALKLDCFDVFAGPAAPAHGAVLVAARHPERIGRLVLWQPKPEVGPWPDDEESNAWRTLVTSNWRAMTRTVADRLAPSASQDVKRVLTRLYRETMSPEMYLRDAESDVREQIASIQAPTLVLHARNDAQFALDTSRDAVAAIPDARLVTIEGNSAYFFLYHEQIVPVVREFLGDEAPAPARAPSGVHTILFTDIVSSTALTQRLGDAKMQELVRAHDSIVREALRLNAGHEIKHTGDGIMASFGTASAALECAMAIARGVAGKNDENLQVHVGLNAGEPVAESDDLYGASVQLARRLCDHSEAGQIVVADVVRQLALGKGFSFAALPEAALKGFDDPVRAYELVWREELASSPDGLTAREVEVLRLIAAGRTNTEIATELTLSVRTVARHITNIYTKIGARNKAEATDYVHRNKLT